MIDPSIIQMIISKSKPTKSEGWQTTSTSYITRAKDMG